MTLTKDQIIALINSDIRALQRAIVVVYENQTDSERNGWTTKVRNGVGFNKIDAPIMCSIATQIQNGRTLSPKQIAVARRIIVKYAGQIEAAAIAKTKKTVPAPIDFGPVPA